MTLRIEYDGREAGQALRHGLSRAQDRIQASIKATMDEASQTILRLGRADMASAGNFTSARWQEGLHAEETFTPRASVIKVFHDVPFFNIFQKGGVIRGRPLLWIPLSFSDAVGTRARDYPGGLFRVDRKSGGAPLLLSPRDGKPKYFGKPSVTIPKKFHIAEIVRQVAHMLRDIYSRNFRARTK